MLGDLDICGTPWLVQAYMTGSLRLLGMLCHQHVTHSQISLGFPLEGSLPFNYETILLSHFLSIQS
jgi:hypothetical protein